MNFSFLSAKRGGQFWGHRAPFSARLTRLTRPPKVRESLYLVDLSRMFQGKSNNPEIELQNRCSTTELTRPARVFSRLCRFG